MYKVIDIFAGPGGLSEGFSSYIGKDGSKFFEISLSIEKDTHAFETLMLRSFYRQFVNGPPDDYYDLLRGRISQSELYARYPVESAEASRRCWKVTLGSLGVTTKEVRERVQNAVGGDENLILIGGPPCQAYSLVGRSRNAGNPSYDPEKDERQRLYVEYLQFLADFRPLIFVMENVKGILSATFRKQSIFKLILQDIQRPAEALLRENRNLVCDKKVEYRIYSLKNGKLLSELNLRDSVIKAEDFGVPQTRHRVFLLGIRADLPEVIPKHLTETLQIPISKVISDLPAIRSGLSEKIDSPSAWEETIRSQLTKPWVCSPSKRPESPYIQQTLESSLKKLSSPLTNKGNEFIETDVHVNYNSNWYEDSRLHGVCNHTARSHLDSDLFRYFYAACFARFYGTSPKLRDFPEALLPDHSNVDKALDGNKNFSDRFRVQLFNLPSKTVVSHISKDGHYYIHPDPLQCRSLTVREAARIQTFPDNYYFCGPRTSQYIQVGNAVPPLLAKQIAEIVSDILEMIKCERLLNL